MSENDSPLQFAPLDSFVDASFWHSLATRKLDVLRLSEAALPVQAYYSCPLSEAMAGRFCVPAQGLEKAQDENDTTDDARPPFSYPAAGELINTNTLDDFKRLDKNRVFKDKARKIWGAIRSGAALTDPALLNDFVMLTYADLKRYKFYYWFAFPALMPTAPWQLLRPMYPITDEFTQQEIAALTDQVDQRAYFLIKREPHGRVRIGQLCEWDTLYGDTDERMVGFADPSNMPHAAGWPLRNLLALAHQCWGVCRVKVLCYRAAKGSETAVADMSRLLVTELPHQTFYDATQEEPKAVGWERNAQGKLAPRMADLGPLMDPTRLANTSVDLNLKLMRWRVLPDLDLEKIKRQKCLLLGAGTLGCYVARVLAGWGVRHITFVDNGRVSFSNPVRQPLYQFDDCLNGGAPKAETAARQLKAVQPTIHATGHDLSIPMPGHNFSSSLHHDLDRLSSLINEHDSIFLLTDSRESRWLPTLLAREKDKIVINAALGFDTYVVMRHGPALGCYFCNDIVAPTDSLTDRTLDQQCTVTRPGLAAMAGALGVELLVSILQHPDGIHAAAGDEGLLGKVPHQIRGFLGQFNNMLIVGQPYDCCTACSEKVRGAYRQDPQAFVERVLREPEYLEEISGIAQLKAESDLLDEDAWGGEEDDF